MLKVQVMDIKISSAQRNVLLAINQTSRAFGSNQLALASGKDVNSALDNPQNFFQAQSLFFRAGDLSKVMDNISQSIRTIEEANNGIEAKLKLIDTAEALVREGLLELFPATDEIPDPEAIQYIIDNNPDKAYFAETNNFYENTPDLTNWSQANQNASTRGLTGVPELTGHLATITSQNENDFVQALLTSSSWLGGSDNEAEGEWFWLVGPEAGQQFWQGLAGGTAQNGFYTNWAPGEPNQFFGPGNPENYAHMRADGFWNDLPEADNLNYIIEWGGDLLISNPDINVSSDSVRYRQQYLEILQQIDSIATDANYQGLELLNGEDLITRFNEDGDSKLTTEGMDASTIGLGLTNDNFISKIEMTKIISELQDAREQLREYSASVQNDLSIIKSRSAFIEQNINTFKSGAADLTVADQNEQGANFLSLQTRQALQFESLSLTRPTNILDLFS